MRINSKGQVWIETVLYTLIGLALIGIALSVITPKINEYRDKILIEQTINSLLEIDKSLQSVAESQGNRQIVEFLIKRGVFTIDSQEDSLKFYITDLEKPYSESGSVIERGRVRIKTENSGNSIINNLWIDYSDLYNLIYDEGNSSKDFPPSPVNYKFSMENLGLDEDGRIYIKMEEISGR